MRSLLIVAALLLLMTAGAFAVAPVVAPIPPGVIGPPIVSNPTGSVSGTKIHSDISDDIGIIVDGANDMAYKSWWVHNPYVALSTQAIAGALKDTATTMTEDGVGFSSWLSVKWDLFKQKLGELGQLENYPVLENLLGGYWENDLPPAPMASGEALQSELGGYFEATGSQYYWGAMASTLHAPCPTNPDTKTPTKVGSIDYNVGLLQIYSAGGQPAEGTVIVSACTTGPTGVVPGQVKIYKQNFVYHRTYTGDVLDEWPVAPPGVWNPAVDQVLNDPAVQTNPAVKEEIGNVIADNPDVLNPILDKLTAAALAATVAADGLELASQKVQSLAEQLSADPTNVTLQNALNDALAEQVAPIQEELEKQAVVDAEVPAIDVVELKTIDWTPLSGLIGAACAKLDKKDCPFPFDFIHVLGLTFDEFQNEQPSMIDPSGNYGLDKFKINFNFDFSRFTETMAKIRLILSWIMTIYTIHKCVRIVMRDNSSGDDD